MCEYINKICQHSLKSRNQSKIIVLPRSLVFFCVYASKDSKINLSLFTFSTSSKELLQRKNKQKLEFLNQAHHFFLISIIYNNQN